MFWEDSARSGANMPPGQGPQRGFDTLGPIPPINGAHPEPIIIPNPLAGSTTPGWEGRPGNIMPDVAPVKSRKPRTIWGESTGSHTKEI